MTSTTCRHTLYTIGHSNRTWEVFLALLKAHEIRALADIRRFPGSRRLPQYGADALEKALEAEGIHYISHKDLGGRRKPSSDSQNCGWRHPAFRAYADYMQTGEFQQALRQLLDGAKAQRTVIMCSEAVPWRCHRNLVADAAVLLHDWDVRHIMTEKSAPLHKPASFAVIDGTHLVYPADDFIGNC